MWVARSHGVDVLAAAFTAAVVTPNSGPGPGPGSGSGSGSGSGAGAGSGSGSDAGAGLGTVSSGAHVVSVGRDSSIKVFSVANGKRVHSSTAGWCKLNPCWTALGFTGFSGFSS